VACRTWRRVSGHTLKNGESPGTDGDGIRKGAGARRREEGLQELGPRGPRLKQAVTKPEYVTTSFADQHVEGSRKFTRGCPLPAATLVGTAGNTTETSGGELRMPERHFVPESPDVSREQKDSRKVHP
jgi:hypothetical protein